MEIAFFFLWIVALIVMVVSIVNPKLAIIPFVINSRVKAGLIWFGISAVFLILMMAFSGTDNAQARYDNAIQIQAEATPKPTKEIKATKTPKPTKEPTATPKPTDTPIPTATPIDIYSMTDEEYVDYVLKKSSDETYFIDDAIYDKSFYDAESNTYIMEAYTGGWIFDDMYWTLMERHNKKIFYYIYQDKKMGYDNYKLIFNRDFTDDYGNVYISKGAEMVISKETLDKINWDNLRKVTFVEIADEFIEYYE